jgi:N-acetyl-1-D-myo-inositol-2-amino-2-deoxy-alpha-D-glucopyranoside deacetylase
LTTDKRLLVTVAHPDDETYGTGSVIAAAVTAGVQVTVCCATRGEAGQPVGRQPSHADLGAVREAELRAAGDVLGVSRIVLLGFLDSGMSGEPPPGALAAAPFPAVVTALREVVADADPHVVVTLDPIHGDGHRDHTRIGQATIEARRDRPNTRVYAWAIERTLLHRWFTEIAHLRPGTTHLDLDKSGLGRPTDQITTVLNVSHVRQIRERAIAMHASQTSPYDGMPADLRDEFLLTDRLVRLQPAHTGGLERSLFE